MNEEIIEKIAEYYHLDSEVLLQDYKTVSTLHYDIRPESRDIIMFLVLMSLNQKQFLYKPLGKQLKVFIETLYSSEEFLNSYAISAYTSFDDFEHELHVLDIIYDLNSIEFTIDGYTTDFLPKLQKNFGDNGINFLVLIAKYHEDIYDYQDQIDNLIENYEKEYTFDKEHILQVAKDLGLKAKFNSNTPGIKNAKTGKIIEFTSIIELFTDDHTTQTKEKINMKKQFNEEINEVYEELQDKICVIKTEFNNTLEKIESDLENIKSEVNELHYAESTQEVQEIADNITEQIDKLLYFIF